MRIIYLSDSVIPSRTANSVHVMKMCDAFAENGHNVTLVARKPSGEDPDDVFSRYGIENGFGIVLLNKPDFPGGSLIYAVNSVLEARRKSTDLVYSRYLPSAVLAAASGTPVIFEAHVPVRTDNPFKRLIFNKFMNSRSMRKIVVISNALKEHFVNNYQVESNRVIVAHDAAELPFSDNKKKLGGKGKLKAGYVGQLYPGKGMELIAELAARCGDVDFHIVGGTEDDISFWKNSLSGCHNVIFHGFVDHSETQTYINAFDVVLAPYQSRVSSHDGGRNIALWMSPLKIFEYMAAGKPIICSDIPVLREVLADGRNALLCDPVNIDKWAETLRKLNTDNALKKTLGENAKKDFIENYTWKIRAKNVLAGL